MTGFVTAPSDTCGMTSIRSFLRGVFESAAIAVMFVGGGLALAAALNAPIPDTRYGVFRM